MFGVYNKDDVLLGTLTAGGYNKTATANTNYTETIIMNATKVTSAAATTGTAAYYDKDGNKIAANDLDKYFSTTYSGKTDATGTNQRPRAGLRSLHPLCL